MTPLNNLSTAELQLFATLGLNPFAIKLVVESYRLPHEQGRVDERKIAFAYDGVQMSIQPFRPEKKQPKIVCLCGSTRFMEAFQSANLSLTLAGNIVLSVGCNTKSDASLQLGIEDKERLDDLHKRKIDLADEILVLNVGGYIGDSTRSEIAYAQTLGKPINYLEQ